MGLTHLLILPVQFAEELENLVHRLFHQNIVKKMFNEGLYRGELHLFSLYTLGRVALIVCILEDQLLSCIKVLSRLLASHDFHLRE